MGDHVHEMALDRQEHWSEQLPEHLHQYIEDHWHPEPEPVHEHEHEHEHEHLQEYESPIEEEVPESSNPIVLMFSAGFETGSLILGSIFNFPLELMGKISEI